jgi:hypothetical protein
MKSRRLQSDILCNHNWSAPFRICCNYIITWCLTTIRSESSLQENDVTRSLKYFPLDFDLLGYDVVSPEELCITQKTTNWTLTQIQNLKSHKELPSYNISGIKLKSAIKKPCKTILIKSLCAYSDCSYKCLVNAEEWNEGTVSLRVLFTCYTTVTPFWCHSEGRVSVVANMLQNLFSTNCPWPVSQYPIYLRTLHPCNRLLFRNAWE